MNLDDNSNLKPAVPSSNMAEVNVGNLFQWKRPRWKAGGHGSGSKQQQEQQHLNNAGGGPSGSGNGASSFGGIGGGISGMTGGGGGGGISGPSTPGFGTAINTIRPMPHSMPLSMSSPGTGSGLHTNSPAQSTTPGGGAGSGVPAAERPLHTLQSPARVSKSRHRSSAATSSLSSSSSVATIKSLVSASSSLTSISRSNPSDIGSSSSASHSSGSLNPATSHLLANSSSPPSAVAIDNSGPNSRSSSSSSIAGISSAANITTSASASASRDQTKTVSTLDLIEMDNPNFSFWGPDLVPLPSRFARIKRNLIAGNEAALEASWIRIIAALNAEVEHIEGLGSHLIPSIEFSEIENPSQTARFGRDLKRYGVGVVRGVVPRVDADIAVRETVRYLQTNHDSKPPPLPQDPTCFDFFWTPAQVHTRAHPSVLRCQRFMMGLWGTTREDRLVIKYPISYADRIRIHAPTMASGTPEAPSRGSEFSSPNGIHGPVAPPKSADDWLSAIQSSGIIAQVDNGSLERWEPDGYQREGTYNEVFKGNWEDYDPWECSGRSTASSDLYNGYGACSIFRMFQGLVALSAIEPGMIRLLPSPRLVTAYFLLRPFFSPRTPPPTAREGPEWEAFLSPSNWSLDREQNSYVHGAVPGHAQRVTELWHPHLQLRRSMITLPTLQAGDYIMWHPDLAYHISSSGAGLRSPIYGRPDEVSMLVYVPAAPLTQNNALYLARQRKAFLRGQPGPDFDSTGSGLESEAPQTARLGEKDIAEIGGTAGLQAMGLAMYESAGTPPPETKDKAKARDGDVEMDEAETKSISSSSSTTHAEAEVIRLANIILFPDKAMMGFP